MTLQKFKSGFYTPAFVAVLSIFSVILNPSMETIISLSTVLISGIIAFLVLHRSLKFTAFYLTNILLIFLILPPETNPIFTAITTILTAILHRYSKKDEKYVVYPVILGLILTAGFYFLFTSQMNTEYYWFLPKKNSVILTLIIIYAITNVSLWQRYIIFLTFLSAHFGLLLLREIPMEAVLEIFEKPELYFFLTVILIEPKTTPTNPILQGVYGLFAAIVYNIYSDFNIPYPDFLTVLSAITFYRIKLEIGKSHKALHFFKKVGGIIMIVIGIIGWLIPVIPGWPLLIPGIILVAPEYGERVKSWFEKRQKR